MALTSTTDGAQAVRTLAEILTDKDGKAFISRLDSKDAELCVEILSDVGPGLYLPCSHPHPVRQGIATEHNLGPAEKQAFFVALRRLAERYGLLPSRMRIAERIEVSDELLASSPFADLRSGTYRGHLVGIKTLKVTARDDFVKIRKVSVNGILAPSRCAASTVYSSGFARKLSSGAPYHIGTS